MSYKSFSELGRVAKYLYLKDLTKQKTDDDEVEAGPCEGYPPKIPRLDDGSSFTSDAVGLDDASVATSSNIPSENKDNELTRACCKGESITQSDRIEAANLNDPNPHTSSSEEEPIEEDDHATIDDSDNEDDYHSIADENEESEERERDEQNNDSTEPEYDEAEERDETSDDNDDQASGQDDEEEDNPNDGRGQPHQPPLENDDARPLYTGASITVAESMLLILTLFLKHNITGSCLSDILIVINFHCLNQGFKKLSLYKFRKYFSMSEQKFKKHFYCSNCLTSIESENSLCSTCNAKRGVSYFIEMPFLIQLREMFSRERFHELLQRRLHRGGVRPGTIRDINDATLYKKYLAFLLNPNNISLMWYTDGVPVFKSSKISMWPVFLVINELPYKHRMKQENTILAGLWFGNKKPAANQFIYKLKSEFEKLFEGENFTLPDGRDINVRGMLLTGTCDLPAKAEFLNFIAFNGQCGCPNCKNPGQTFTHATGGTSRVYLYEQQSEMRTSAETNANAHQAWLSGRPVNGVKGPSSLSRIMPDFIEGVAIDYMHGIFCGVTKRLLSLWFDSGFSGRPFSLSTVSAIIDEKLLQIKPPKWVHRLPRSVAEFVHWKASELRMWFFYYSVPILESIMRPDYFAHYLCLVSAIAILDSDLITQDQIGTAKSLLHKFVREFENLYGLQFCTINVHQLLHLPVCVERLGPLWVYSCFPFEDLNGKLLRFVNGTSHLESQIASAHTYLLTMRARFDRLTEGPIRDFALAGRSQVKICQQVFRSCYSVGTYNKYTKIPASLEQAIGILDIPLGNVQSYKRLLKDSKLIVSESYARRLRTSSSHVLYGGRSGEKMLGCVHNFIKISYCDCEKECLCEGQHYAFVQEIVETDVFQIMGDGEVRSTVSYLKKCHKTDNTSLVPVSVLESVCVVMTIDDNFIIGLPINSMELE